MKKTNLPKIAIVGRPNVGKSSLFNRILGARSAIVESSSGTTRDRLYADVRWKGKSFTIIDTAGFDDAKHDSMSGLMLKQVRMGIEEADIIFFVTDGKAGIVPQDRDLASMLRKTSKKVYLIVNKVDSASDSVKAMEFFELGLGDPYAVSAMHDRGIEKLCNDAAKSIETSDVVENANCVKVAIVGRPNVGKSSYLNSILSEERVIVHPVAGTTRDAIDIDFNYKDKDYVLIDTAGIRHDTKMGAAADFYGIVRSKEAISRCDVAIVLIDGYEGLTKDDARIIELCIEEGKALIIAVNKWDLAEAGVRMPEYKDRLIKEMNLIRNFPVVFISCKTGRSVKDTLDVIWSVFEKSRTSIPASKLAVIRESLNNAAEMVNKRIKFKYLVQEDALPPKFILGLRGTRDLNDNQKRFIENFFRMAYDFEGTPIIIRFEKTSKK